MTKEEPNTEATTEKVEATSAPESPSRDELRAKIFGAKPKSEMVENFLGGVTIELRQPSINEALNMREGSEDDRIFNMLTRFAFVPGTKEKLFDPEDVENIKNLPFGEETQELMSAINKLLGVSPEEVENAVKDAEKSA